MTKTEELEARIKANEIQIKRLYNENIDLQDAINISGNYTEKEEVWTYGKGKTKREIIFYPRGVKYSSHLP